MPLRETTIDAHHRRADGIATGDGVLLATGDGLCFIAKKGRAPFTYVGARTATYTYAYEDVSSYGLQVRRTRWHRYSDVLIDSTSDGQAVFGFYPAEAANLLMEMLRKRLPDREVQI